MQPGFNLRGGGGGGGGLNLTTVVENWIKNTKKICDLEINDILFYLNLLIYYMCIIKCIWI